MLARMAPAEPARKYISFREYTELVAASETKAQWLDGEVFAMAGGTPEHAALAMAVGTELRRQLTGKPCRVYSSDLRIRVAATGLATYPDVSVICGKLETDPEEPNTATNPIVIVEVLSDTTEAYDRGRKFEHYRRLSSLREYVLVSQHEPHIEVFRRNAEGHFILDEATKGGSVVLPSIDCTLDVDSIFANPLATTAG